MILSFDTSEKIATVALVDRGNILANANFEQWMREVADIADVGQSTAVISIIKSVLGDANVEPSKLSTVAMSNGPGGFTGLRVGVVVARMLCYAWAKPLIAVDSLEVSATKLVVERKLAAGSTVWAAVNGQRRQLFAAKFQVLNHVADEPILEVLEPQKLHHHADWIALLESRDHVTGAGALALSQQIESVIEAELPDQPLACCDAVAVARLAQRRLNAKRFDDLWKVAPVYFRPSAAEEVRSSADKAKETGQK